ncbi:MAG TPA: hypothetical protein PLU30_27230 [Verrucomicrobiae bacterium]|nr:hypothetical protein [Verrucomicrobiae bacterium]
MLPLTIAAQVALDIPPDGLMSAIWLAGFAVIVSIGAGLATIWDKFRRKPPVDETFATKAEVRSMEERLTVAISETRADNKKMEDAVFHRINEVDKTLATGMRDVARSVGQLEGGNKVAHAIETAIERLVENCAMKQRIWEARRLGAPE